MNDNDLKVLKFRKELKGLLNKYNYNISGTVLDDGSMNIEDKSSGNMYYMKDEYSNYNVSKEVFMENENYDYTYVDIMEDYILSSFINRELNFDNSKMRIGIITSNQEKADGLFEEIFNRNKESVKRYIDSKSQKEILLNDDITCYVWVKPYESSKGYKLKSAYIDKDIEIEIFENVIIPICAYCKKDDIKII